MPWQWRSPCCARARWRRIRIVLRLNPQLVGTLTKHIRYLRALSQPEMIRKKFFLTSNGAVELILLSLLKNYRALKIIHSVLTSLKRIQRQISQQLLLAMIQIRLKSLQRLLASICKQLLRALPANLIVQNRYIQLADCLLVIIW